MIDIDEIRNRYAPPISPIPTPEEIDACPDPVGAVEMVTGLRWADGGGVGVSQHLEHLADLYEDWTRVNALNVNGAQTVAQVRHPWTSSTHEALKHGSLAVLHALAEGRAEMPEGAPGWAVWGAGVNRVAALFVDEQGVYPHLLGDEMCWGVSRDARRYPGPFPLIAHPPCNLWGRFARVNFKRWGGEHNRTGNDGGMFASALESVRRFGGILEHPAQSYAWQTYGLPPPSGIGWHQVGDMQWVCEVWQSAYGHLARKRTWLFYNGMRRPGEGIWERPEGSHQIGFHDQRGKERNKPTVSGRRASATPIAFAEWLTSLALQSR